MTTKARTPTVNGRVVGGVDGAVCVRIASLPAKDAACEKARGEADRSGILKRKGRAERDACTGLALVVEPCPG
jgi:hypothetical protein